MKLVWFSVIMVLCCSFSPIQAPAAKSYAVFVVSYNENRAVGGVAGTAFFIGPNKAITAYHVLNKSSFERREDLTTTRIWLVHEGEPAIELFPDSFEFHPGQDTTLIYTRQKVQNRYIYERGVEPESRSIVTTEGFIANSTGPVVERVGGKIEITSVPRLSRRLESGFIIESSSVTISSYDVNMKGVPCLQLSYKPVVGFSGGPVIYNGRVIGMNSFAEVKTRSSTFAVTLGD